MSRPVKRNFWDVLQAFEKETEIRNLLNAMNGWLRQEHFPELLVILDNATMDVETVCYNSTKLDIPFNILSVSNIDIVKTLDNIIWLECPKSVSMPVLDDIDFVIVNLQQFGKYWLRKLLLQFACTTVAFITCFDTCATSIIYSLLYFIYSISNRATMAYKCFCSFLLYTCILKAENYVIFNLENNKVDAVCMYDFMTCLGIVVCRTA